MIDNIFGNLISPEDRLDRTRGDLEGVKHLLRRSPLDPVPGQPVILTLTTGGPIPYDSARCYFSLDGSNPDAGSARIAYLILSTTEWNDLAWGYVQTWQAQLPHMPAGTLIRYRLAAHRSPDGPWIYADNQAENEAIATCFALWVDNDPVPAWSHQALVYHIFVDRFNPGSGLTWKKTTGLGDFFGGTLRGITEKLDYIQNLGMNTLWLSPFFKSTSHHGYNASDYTTVEPRLGTLDDLHELIEKTHSRGMRILLDFVANHWSKDHATFQDASRNPSSPYHDWYIWHHWPDDYEAYFKVKELPKLNLTPGPAREYLLNVARYWLQAGFDGFRLDFAYGPPQDFWVDFRRACRAVKPDCWIFGEVVHSASVQRSLTGIMDGTLDFLLARALRETFAFERMPLAEFMAFLAGHEAYFSGDFSRPAFLDNHDMSRFLYISGDHKEKLKLAALVLYTLSGPPILYNGTEAGVTQERPMQQGTRYVFEEARMPMKWDEQADQNLIDYFSRLGNLRHNNPVLSTGKRLLVHLDSEKNTCAYLLRDEVSTVLVAINLSQKPQSIFIPNIGLKSLPEVDRLNGNPVRFDGERIEIILPAYGGAFIV